MSVSQNKPDNPQTPKKSNTADTIAKGCIGCLVITVIFMIFAGISMQRGAKRFESSPHPVVEQNQRVAIPTETLQQVATVTQKQAYDEIEGLLKVDIDIEPGKIYILLTTEKVLIWEAIRMCDMVLDMYELNLQKFRPEITLSTKDHYSNFWDSYEVTIGTAREGEGKIYWGDRKSQGRQWHKLNYENHKYMYEQTGKDM